MSLRDSKMILLSLRLSLRTSLEKRGNFFGSFKFSQGMYEYHPIQKMFILVTVVGPVLVSLLSSFYGHARNASALVVL